MQLLGPIKPKFPLPLDDRFYVDSSEYNTVEECLAEKARQNTSYVYMRVVDLYTGKSWELQPNGTWVLFTAKGEKGDPGTNGKSLEFIWDGYRLGVRREGDSQYTYSQSLRGQEGPTGKSLQFTWNGTQLGVKVEGDIYYTYVDLQGPEGPTGKSLMFDWNGTMLGVKREGDINYTYVDLKGSTPTTADVQQVILDGDYEDTSGDPPDPDIYLYTQSKKIIGAINEINEKINNIISSI